MNDMEDSQEADRLSEFSAAWVEFESALAGLIESLAQPTLHDTVRLHHPEPVARRQIVLAGGFLEGATGVFVSLGEHATSFCAVDFDEETYPDLAPTAAEVVRHLRDVWLIPHPALVVASADGIGQHALRRLGLQGPADVPKDGRDLHPARRVARREPVRDSLDAFATEGTVPELVWPASPEALRRAVEEVLDSKYGVAEADSDGDYFVDLYGTGFFVSILDDRPLIRLWKTVVRNVRSRRAAVVEANYLNRTYPLAGWVLWGHDLIQEIYVPAVPFVPSRFIEMLDLFDDCYSDNLSALKMRLAEEV